jgi:P22 coat protein - gene protein 5
VPNAISTISMVTRRALSILRNNLKAASQVSRTYDNQFAQSGAKVGATINIRVPARFVIQNGPAITPQDFIETSTPLTIQWQPVVPVQFTSAERALSLDDYSQRVLEPAIATLANDLDRKVLELYSQVWNSVVVDTTSADSLFNSDMAAGALLDENAAPRDRFRSIVVGPRPQASAVSAFKGLFQSAEQIANQYETGNMGLMGGFRWSMDQNVVAHLTGPRGGVPVVNNNNQTGSQLITDGWTAAAALRVRKGDVFTIAGVYSVNPQSKQSTGTLQQFTATANASSDISGNATISIQPAITLSPNPYQTVDASPVDGAPLTFLGTANTQYSQGLAFHRDAFAMATVDLDLPTQSAEASRASDDQLGVSLRITRQWASLSDQWITRVECLHGESVPRPEWAVRLWQPLVAA